MVVLEPELLESVVDPGTPKIRLPKLYTGLPGPLIRQIGNRRLFEVGENYRLVYGDLTLLVPDGFRFDLASIPKLAWWIIDPFQATVVAALAHDILYHYGGRLPPEMLYPYQEFTRSAADRMFLELMKREGVNRVRRKLAYKAVVAFGEHAWGTRTLGQGRSHFDGRNIYRGAAAWSPQLA
jgi:hypothetical protein